MVARIATVAFQGVETLDIDVQVHLANGIPAFSIVGLPAKAVDESKDRVRAALQALGLALPPQRITVNLAPAGGHNLIMIGPPGAGKSMLAARLPGLLPPLDAGEALEVSVVQSVAGSLANGRISRRRPYRDPHHSSSIPALVGGGSRAKPGEVLLAHRGVLFLDELAEFPRHVLDSMRQSIETG